MEQNETGYQGWTNYETWLVNLWIENDQGTQEYWQDQAKECLSDHECNKESAATVLADMLASEHYEAVPVVQGAFSDLIDHALGVVNWHEIAADMLADCLTN